MVYSPDGRLGAKAQHTTTASTYAAAVSQRLRYGYSRDYQSHAPRRIANRADNTLADLLWDADGRLNRMDIYSGAGDYLSSRHLYWDEDARMTASVDSAWLGYYGYDHAGERTLKFSGSTVLLDENTTGPELLATLDNATLYASPT